MQPLSQAVCGPGFSPLQKRLSSLAIGTLWSCGIWLLPVASGADDTDLFTKEVRPILETSCVRCHGPDQVKGALRLSQRALVLKGGQSGPAAIPGQSAASLLIRRVSLPADHDDVMPAEGKPLAAEQVQILRRWIDGGMVWPEGVELQPRANYNPAGEPRAGNALSRYNLGQDLKPATPAQVDRLIAEDNRGQTNILVAAVIDDLEFLRKVSVDLIGRIPTYREIQQYRALPESKRRAQVVEELLRHPRFVDRWTTFYADMMRIRVGAEGGDYFMAYVRQSLETGRGYDRMVNDLISASGIPRKNPAVGYALGDNADPLALAAATSQVFLGVRMGCAQCHNHPFDKWTQQQFYQFAGFFGQTQRVSREIAHVVFTKDVPNTMSVQWPPEDKARGKPRHAVHPTLPFALEQFDQPPAFLRRFQQRRDQELARERTQAEEDGLVHSLEAAALGENRRGDGQLPLERLGADLRAQVDQQLENQFVTGKIRQTLAEQITSPRNRFFSRALVNRVWAEVLGHGFYEPIDDFRDSTLVSHPRALEYLADEFVASAYDLRSLLKLIVLTEAYQRGHLPPTTAPAIRESSAKAFTAAAMRRMEGESLYDSIVTAGSLQDYKWPAGANLTQMVRWVSEEVPVEDSAMMAEEVMADGRPRTMTGGYDLENSAPLDLDSLLKTGPGTTMAELPPPMIPTKKEAEKAAAQRRTRVVYRQVKETIDDNPKFGSAYRIASPAPPPHFLRVFGQPGRQQLGEFRTTAPSMRQELMLLNGQLSQKASEVGSYEALYGMLTSIPPQIDPAIHRAYLEILTRNPSPAEVDEARRVLREAHTPLSGMADLRWALLNSLPFRYLP